MTDRQTIAQQVLDRIAACEGNLNLAFPDPFRFSNNQRGRRQAFFDRELAHLLTERDPTKPWGWEANGAFFVVPNRKAVEAFVAGDLDIVPHRWRTGHGKPSKSVAATSSQTGSEGRVI